MVTFEKSLDEHTWDESIECYSVQEFKNDLYLYLRLIPRLKRKIIKKYLLIIIIIIMCVCSIMCLWLRIRNWIEKDDDVFDRIRVK